MVDVSVIVPTLNEEANIAKTLKLVRAQRSHLDYEVIVSDGGSEDRTAEIAKKYADRVVVGEKRGIWFGRNQGAKAAKGEVYVFIDADTIIPKNYVDSVYPAFGDPGIAGLCAPSNSTRRAPSSG